MDLETDSERTSSTGEKLAVPFRAKISPGCDANVAVLISKAAAAAAALFTALLAFCSFQFWGLNLLALQDLNCQNNK